VIPHLSSYYASKSASFRKSHKMLYFSHLSRSPRVQIFAKFCTGVVSWT